VSGKLRRQLPLLFVLALAVVPYREFFSDRVPAARDLLFYFLPAKAHLAEAVRAGEMPWIDRYRWGGAPLLSNPGYAAFDPGNLLFVLLPLAAAAKTWILLRLVLGVAGFSLFGRRLGLGSWAAGTAGLLYGLSGVSVSLAPFLGASAAWSLLPWFALATLDARRRGGEGALVKLAVVSALLLVAGAPEFLVYAVLISLALSFGRPVEEDRAAGVPVSRRVVVLVSGAFLGAALSAPALLSGLVTAAESTRAPGGGLTTRAAQEGALPPERLKELLADGLVEDWTRRAAAPSLPDYYPYLPSLTPGRVGILLAFTGLLFGSRGRFRAAALCVVGVLLGLGPATPVWGAAVRGFPPLGSIRYPEKHLILAGFGLAWLGALGLKAVSRRLPDARMPLVSALLGLAILGDREGVARRLNFTAEPRVLAAPPGALAPLVNADPVPARLFHRDSYVPVPKFYLSDIVLSSRIGVLSLTPEYPSLFGVASAFALDYDLTLPLEAVEWTRLLRTALPRGGPIPANFLRTAGVAAIAASERAPDGTWALAIHPVPEPLSPYRFAARVVANEDGRALFKTFLDERCDPDTAYVEGPARGAAPSAGRVLGVRDRPSGLELSVESDGPEDSFLALFRLRQVTEEATLDGHPVAVADAGFGFSGLRVPAGRHLVRLRPDTLWVKIGAMATLAAAAVLGFLAWRARRPGASAS
jgi:hypothetical protein